MIGTTKETGKVEAQRVRLVVRILRHRHIANPDGLGLFRLVEADFAMGYKYRGNEIEDAFRYVADLLDHAGYPMTLEVGADEVCHYVGTDEVIRRIEDAVRKQGS